MTYAMESGQLEFKENGSENGTRELAKSLFSIVLLTSEVHRTV